MYIICLFRKLKRTTAPQIYVKIKRSQNSSCDKTKTPASMSSGFRKRTLQNIIVLNTLQTCCMILSPFNLQHFRMVASRRFAGPFQQSRQSTDCRVFYEEHLFTGAVSVIGGNTNLLFEKRIIFS